MEGKNLDLPITQIVQPLKQALLNSLSEQTVSQDSRRIFHGRGQCFSGLEWCVVDAFESLLLMTVFVEPEPALLAVVQRILVDGAPSNFTHIAIQRRDQNGAPYAWLKGEAPVFGAIKARRLQQSYLLDFNQQNCGFFLDMEPGRKWLESELLEQAGAKVLNLFAYTCAFSVVAIAAGAEKVVNVDLSRRSLTTGRENHRANNHDTTKVQFLGVDILKSWGKIKRGGPYDFIVVDPPSFQKGSFVATKDYRKVVRRLPELLGDQGKILACLNAPEFDSTYVKDIFTEMAPELAFEKRLAASEDFPDVDVEQQLKLLVYSVTSC